MYNYVYDEGGVYIKNLSNNGEKYGLSQYSFPRNYELSGNKYELAVDGKNYELDFFCKHYMKFNGKKFDYEAIKLTTYVFFVRFGHYFAVIDIERGVATLIIGAEYISGLLSGEFASENREKHTDAGDDMTGTLVEWVFGCDRFVVHNHFEAGKCRVGWAPRPDVTNDLECRSTKIRDGLYLVDLPGKVPYHVCAPILTERVILLEDYDHLLAAGVVISGGETPIMVTGYARIIDEKTVLTLPGGAQVTLD